MNSWRSLATVVATSLSLAVIGSTGQAQRREGKVDTQKLEVTFESAARFDKVVVKKSRYRVNVTAKGLSLANPKTMVPVATIPVVEKTLSSSVTKPSIVVVIKKGVVEVVVKVRNKLYYAKGVVEKDAGPKGRKFQLASKADASLGKVLPEEKSARELVETALKKRYLREVKHCGEQAGRSHWKTDDRRFWNCVCPIAERWRLPRGEKPLRVHQFLVKRRSGLSLTVTPKGKGTECRVWVGTEPPRDETEAEPAAAEQAETPSAAEAKE